jgi:hypothetical protein
MFVFSLLYCTLSIAAYGEIIFQEDFENGWGSWNADNGVWEIGVPTAGPSNTHSLSNCAGTVLGGNYPLCTDSHLISKVIVLPEINDDEDIILQIWHYFRYSFYDFTRYSSTYRSDDRGNIHIKYYDDETGLWSDWIDIVRCAIIESPIWSQTQISLSKYASRPIKIGFFHHIKNYTSNYDKFTHLGWYIDDVLIEKQKKEYFSGIETFENGWGLWSAHNGLWEIGQSNLTPENIGQDKYYIGTLLDTSYPKFTDSYLISPEIKVPFVEGFEEVYVTYWHYFSFDSNDVGRVEVQSFEDGQWSSWNVIKELTRDSGVWTQGSVGVTSYSGKIIRIAFSSHSVDGSSKGWYIDEVRMTPPPKPYLPFSPAPNDPRLENEPITITPTLSWDCLDPSVSKNAKFHVYLGKDDPSNLVSIAQNLTQTACQPEQLTYNTIYYWKIVSIDPENNEYEGSVWKFKTKKEPDITPPTPPSDLIASHALNNYTQNNVIHISWTASDDGAKGTGVAGYDFAWSNSMATTPNGDIDTTETECTSPELTDGNSHWFHIRSKDNANNFCDVVHYGPFFIDLTPPMQGQLIINNGDKYTPHVDVVLTVSAVDEGAGVGQVKFSNNKAEWSTPVDYSETALIDWQLLPGTGDREVCMRLSDKVGNWNTKPFCSKIEINLDPPPDVTDLRVDQTGAGKIVLSWKQILDPSDVTYQVFRSEMENGIYYPITTGIINYENAFNGRIVYEDLNLKSETDYYYKVKSYQGKTESLHFSNLVTGRPESKKNFEIKVLNPSQIKSIFGQAEFDIQVLVNDNADLTFNCIGLPGGTSHGFSVLEGLSSSTSGVEVLKNIDTSCSLSLIISISSATPIDRYPFKIRIFDSITASQHDYTLSLSVIPENSYGIVLNIISISEQKSAAKCLEIPKGSQAKIYGSIFPIHSNKTVRLNLVKEDSEISKTLKTDANGVFEDIDWLRSKGTGLYHLSASWTDSHSNVHTSDIFDFNIIKGNSSITCQRNSQEIIAADKEMTISGELYPPSQPDAKLRFFEPDSDTQAMFKDYTITQDFYTLTGDTLTYSIKDVFFNKKGIWRVKAYWEGNEHYIGCESHTLKIPVDVDYGRAIIIGGGIKKPQNTFWDVTQELSAKIYRHFKHFSFSHDMIYLMLNTAHVDDRWSDQNPVIVDDSSPTVSEVQYAIEDHFIDELDEDNPLFIYMFGHGTAAAEHDSISENVQFQVFGYDEMLDAITLDASLDKLQESKENVTIVLIIETCFSGRFIPILSGPNRVIITCTGDNQYRLDASGENAFSGYLFRKLREGDRFEKAFEYAKHKYVSLGYESPLLDDNGDKVANIFDGSLARSVEMINVASPLPEIKSIIVETTISETIVPIQVDVNIGEQPIETVTARVIPSDVNLIENDTLIQFKESHLTYNDSNGHYEGMLGGFCKRGLHKIIVAAQDIKGNISLPEMAYVTVKNISTDINKDCVVDLLDVIAGLNMLTQVQTDSIVSFSDNNEPFGLENLIQIMQIVSK